VTRLTQRFIQITVAAAAGAGNLVVSDNAPLSTPYSLVSTADACIGRPLTPLSYAGVARRTTRRAVAAGAAVGAAAVVVTTRCVQAVDAYGRVYTRW
jgi:hypothetical protein